MTDLNEIKAFLKKQGQSRSARGASAFETIRNLLPDITALKRKHFTDREICAMLSEKGVQVSLGTFQQYVHRAKRAAEGKLQSVKSAVPSARRSKSLPSGKREATMDEKTSNRLGHRLNEDL